MEPDPGQQWIASLHGLSDEPVRRAAQIALAAIDRMQMDDSDRVPLDAAYEALQAALA